MSSTLERDIRFLKRYAIVATLVGGVAILAAFTQGRPNQKFEEIDVERINIVEHDGRLRMVISNEARQHPGIVSGKVIERSGPRPPGLIFFNHLGDEMGGLIFGENGEVGHFGSLTFDKVRGDQSIGFRHLESDNGSYMTGLEMWQQPDVPIDQLMEKQRAITAIADTVARRQAMEAMRASGELTTRRLFLGKGRDNTTSLVLSDIKGRPRIRLAVTADGDARIEMLDATGAVISSLGPR